ncbi:MAG: hypothetical protein M3016_08620 [Actinomycetota bacterium]|nr:hypothetical protein [Actinomycetota bacterium]
MLASITPLGERGRQSHYAVTMVTFLLGAALAGAGVGLVLGAIGSAALGAVSPSARLVVLAVALAVAIGIDLRSGSAPGPRRQVNEQWLDSYRGWVYGLGFGAQLGLGLSTIVTSAATYVGLLAAVLSGSAAAGALIYGSYGLLRGVTPLLASGVRAPEQLVTLHVGLARGRAPVTVASLAVLGTLLVLAVAGVLA